MAQLRAFLQFGMLSGGGWLLDCAVLLLLSQRFGVALPVANVGSSTLAALTVFTLSRLFIFQKAEERPALRTLLYACYTFGIIAAASAVLGPVAWLSQRTAEALALSMTAGQISFVAKVLITPPQLIANFYMARYLAARRI
jgi:putative flippase GtrA